MKFSLFVSAAILSGTMLASSAAAASSERAQCEVKLADLKVVQATLAKQLNSIPPTIEARRSPQNVTVSDAEQRQGQIQREILNVQGQIQKQSNRCEQVKKEGGKLGLQDCLTLLQGHEDRLANLRILEANADSEIKRARKSVAPTRNRLHEQLQLEIMTAKAGLAAQANRCSSFSKANDAAGLKDCENTLAQKQATLATLEEAVKQVPAQLTTATPNRLYEQLMLENTNTLGQIAAMEKRCDALSDTPVQTAEAPKPAASDAQSDTNLVDTLRNQVSALQTIVANLSAENKRLTALVDKLTEANNTLTGAAPVSPCEQRIAALNKKLDRLYSFGSDDAHPDIRHIKAQLKEVETNCSEAPDQMNASNSCLTRMTDLERKRDSLKSLGYLETHPDVRNIERQLDKVRQECTLASR